LKIKTLFEKKLFRIISLAVAILLIGGFIYGTWINKSSSQNKILEHPGEITVENSLISWNRVENALGYNVSVDHEENEIEEPIFDLSGFTAPKDYNVRIKALGNKTEYFDSDWSQAVKVTRLPAPSLKITKTKLIWNQIEGNNGYELYCDGKYLAHIKKDVNEYDLLNINVECKFQIQAKGDSFYILDSPFSEEISANKLDMPSNLQFNGTHISWKAVDNADKYLIEGDLPSAETESAAYNLQALRPGVYNVSVQALSNREDICNSDKSHIKFSVEKKSLGRLKGVAIEGDRLVWTRLENAGGYKISIKQNQTVKKEIIENATEEFADLLEIELSDGKYTIEIYALGNDIYKDSGKESVSYIKTSKSAQKPELNPIQNAKIHLGVLKWDAVPNASGYVINMTLDNVRVYNTNIAGNGQRELDIPKLNLEAGQYKVTLYALGNNQYNNSPVVSMPYNIIRLGAPENLAFKGTQLSWKSVSNADGYVVTFGSMEPVEVSGNTYNYDKALNPGTHTFSVRAVSHNREIQNSSLAVLHYTEPKHSLGGISNYRIEYGLFKWNALEHAAGYIVAVKSHDKTNIVHTFEKAPANDLEVDLYALELPLGNYTVTIYALGDAFHSNTNEVSVDYQEKMIRDAEVRANFNYGSKYQDPSDYWVQHYLNFSLKQGFTFDDLNVSQAEWNTVYTEFLSESGTTKESAAKAIGNDIIISYYYKEDDGQNTVLLTTGGTPFVKNKLWGGWLWRYNGIEYTQLQGSMVSPFSIGGIVPSATTLQVSANIGNKNPAGGSVAISSTNLSAIKGKLLYVDIDVILRNENAVRLFKETVTIEIANY